VRLWDARTRVAARTLAVGSGVKAVAFSPDGKTLAAGTLDGKVHTLPLSASADGGSTLREDMSASRAVTALAYAREGGLVSASLDGVVRHGARGLRDPGAEVFGLALAADGRTLYAATGGASKNRVAVWDLTSGAIARTLEGPTDFVYSVAISPDGKLVAASSLDTRVRVWNATGTLLYTLHDATERVHAVAFAPDGRTLVTASGSGKVAGVVGKDNTVRQYALP